MTTSTRLALLATITLAGCIDFGFRLPPLIDAADVEPDAAPTDGEPACTEGAMPPSDTGPQLTFATLSVSSTSLAIAKGDVVTWTNTDSMAHTVTAGAPGAEVPVSQGGFDSGPIGPGTRFAYRFCTPRTVIYFCKTHASQMNNYRVVVSP